MADPEGEKETFAPSKRERERERERERNHQIVLFATLLLSIFEKY